MCREKRGLSCKNVCVHITFMVLFGCSGNEMNLDVTVTVRNIINHSDKLKNQKAIDTNLTSS